MPRVLYISHAPEAVYEIIRREMPPGFELVTLDADDEAERIAQGRRLRSRRSSLRRRCAGR